MFKRSLTISDYLLILVNLMPLYGVWFLGWDAKRIFIVYCMETIIIGVINVLKMSFVTLFIKKKDVWENNGGTSIQSGWLFVFFFIAHYGFFVFVQTQLFFAITNMMPNNSLFMKYSKIPQLLGKDGQMMLFIFMAYYAVQSFFTFFSSGKYKNVSMGRLLFEPYARIFIQQFIVILGSFFLVFGASKIFIIILL
ncbi:MAG: hypothetical protein IPP48_00900 [Chitinophagaceae bacterium]|nr:hypothetical protein [Chitinophagaceae bacterium]